MLLLSSRLSSAVKIMATAAKLLAGQCSLAGITHHTCKCTYVHLYAHIHMFMCVCVVICKWNWNLSSLEFEWMFSIFLSILALIVTERCAASTAASANSQFINVKCVCVCVCLFACLPLWEHMCVCEYRLTGFVIPLLFCDSAACVAAYLLRVTFWGYS